MKPVSLSFTLGAADVDGIAQSQSLSAAGALTLNGSFVTSGVAAFDGGNVARQVKFTFAANETGRSFNVFGTILLHGSPVIEAVAGTSVSASTTMNFFSITRVTIDAASAGAMTVGTSGRGASAWVPIDPYQVPVNVGFATEVGSGTLDWTLQYTFDNVWDKSLLPSAVTLFADSAFTAKTTSLNGNFVAPCTAIRLQVNSGTDPITLNVIQAGY